MARGRWIVTELCRELESARLERGLSYADLGRAVGLSGQQVARICQGRSTSISIVRIGALLAAVGLELSARAFPGGAPIRDKAHVALLDRLRDRIATGLVWRLEVPVIRADGEVAGRAEGEVVGRAPLDRRAWDALIEGTDWRVGVEGETRLGDIQSLQRRLALKRRDGGLDALILVLNDTAHNHRVMAVEGVDLREQFPGSARQTLRRLADGQRPAADTVLML